MKEFLIDVAADEQTRSDVRLARIYIAAYFKEDADFLRKAFLAGEPDPEK